RRGGTRDTRGGRRQESADAQEMLELRHPAAELRAALAGAEAVSSFLIDMQFRDRAGLCEIREQLRIRERGRLVRGGRQQERGWIVLQRFAGRRAARAVDE